MELKDYLMILGYPYVLDMLRIHSMELKVFEIEAKTYIKYRHESIQWN